MNFSRVVVKMSGRDVAQRKDNKCSTDKRSKMSPDKKKKKVKKNKIFFNRKRRKMFCRLRINKS